MLTGAELLSYTEKHSDLTQKQLALGAGYTRVTKNGRDQVLVKKFTDALLRAKGIIMRTGEAPGKIARFVTTVHKSGAVLVGKVYSERFGLEPGNQLDIILEDECIRLVPRPAACTAPVVEPADKEMEDDEAA